MVEYTFNIMCLLSPSLFQIKYKQEYERSKGKVIGIKSVSDDAQMAHSALATKLQSDHQYRKNYEDTKTKYRQGLQFNHTQVFFYICAQ